MWKYMTTLNNSSTSLLFILGMWIDSKLKCDPNISLNSSLVSFEVLASTKESVRSLSSGKFESENKVSYVT